MATNRVWQNVVLSRIAQGLLSAYLSGVACDGLFAGECDGHEVPTKLGLPTLPCLGNGLFDHIDNFASRLGATMFRSHHSRCDSSDECDACSAGSFTASYPPFVENNFGYETSDMSASTEGKPINKTLQDSVESTLPPTRIPIRSISPGSDGKLEAPSVPPEQRKLGNPFLDEARANPRKSSLPRSIAMQDVHVAAVKRESSGNIAISTRKRELVQPTQAKKQEIDAVIQASGIVIGKGSLTETFAR